MYNLLIVESPTKCRTIGKFLGKDYKVLASGGHIVDLPKSKMGVDIEHSFTPEYKTMAGKKETVDEIKKDVYKRQFIPALWYPAGMWIISWYGCPPGLSTADKRRY